MNCITTAFVFAAISSLVLATKFPEIKFLDVTANNRAQFQEQRWTKEATWLKYKTGCFAKKYFAYSTADEKVYYVCIFEAKPFSTLFKNEYFFAAFTIGSNQSPTTDTTAIHMISKLNSDMNIIQDAARKYIEFFGTDLENGEFSSIESYQSIRWGRLTDVKKDIQELLEPNIQPDDLF